MRKILITILNILLVVLGACSASAAAQKEESLTSHLNWKPSVLPGAKSMFFHSKATGRDYRIQVGKIGREPIGGYPVLYVLDGDGMFPVAFLHGAALAMQPQDNAKTSMLVVGVGYSEETLLDMNARALDYTPPADDYSNTGDARSEHFGHADGFLSFVNDELKPTIADNYHVDSNNQTLIGHSYGALFALYALFSQPESFSTYIISSPSIWWNNSRILSYFEDFKTTHQKIKSPLHIRITSGSLEQSPSSHANGNDKRVQMLNSRKMVSNACAMAASVANLRNSNIYIEHRNYPNETHGTVIMRAVADGVTYALGIPNSYPNEPSAGEPCP